MMRLVLAADRWLHRVRHGKCYCPWLCTKLSCYEAMKEYGKP
jgi:hypothetical protein